MSAVSDLAYQSRGFRSVGLFTGRSIPPRRSSPPILIFSSDSYLIHRGFVLGAGFGGRIGAVLTSWPL